RLQGFKNYYRLSSASKKWLNRIDWYVLKRLALFNNKKRQRRNLHGHLEEVKKQTQYQLVCLAK
ncbi:Group II intron, maturase-specific domain, partial [Halobacillus alkaliphilus]